MTTSEHDRLEELFSEALSKGTWAERAAFLDGACADNVALRTRVEQLLQVHSRASSFLTVAPIDPSATLAAAPPGEGNNEWIGRYRLLEVIGEGGFGVVHLAEQQEPVRRKVAIKVIKLGMDTKQVIARFEAERQALAIMDHAHIARVLDAGATDTGRPYFVMELVKGVAITAYCDQNRLATRERLQLLLPVCLAVQHAHQKGIIHRDLKPNNVLVTLHDGKPVPKIIDFGIAKATSQRLTDRTLYTESRQFLGTPEYMSPDQAELSGLDVDTRTDVYSLGVLMYELLTGTTPFNSRELREKPYDEIRRIIREVEPPAPSARVRMLAATGGAAEPARRRRTEPAAWARQLDGDLDWIVFKAMEKDRTRRYATAKDLADDIERHLRYEPVIAGAPSVTYRLRKFVRRHQLGVLAAAGIVLAMLAGLSLAIAGLVQANRARAELELQRNTALAAKASEENSAAAARREAARAATVNQFMQQMLRSVDPAKALGRQVTVHYVLDQAAERLDQGALADQPDVEAALRLTLGETYEVLGLYDAAEVQLRHADSIHRRRLGDGDPLTLRASRLLAGVLRVKGQAAEAELLLRPTLAEQRRALGAEHAETLATMSELALALRELNRLDEAEALHRQVLDARRRVLGEEDTTTLASMSQLGEVCRALGKAGEAQTLLQQALAGLQRVLGEENPQTTAAMNNLGRFFEDQRDYEQAESLYRRAWEAERHILGPDHPHTVLATDSLLRVLRDQGKTAEVRPLIVERLERLQRIAERSDAKPYTLHACAWELLNCDLSDKRDPQAAVPLASRAVELDRGRNAGFLETLARSQALTGDLDRAIETQRRAIDAARAGGPFNRSELEATLGAYMLQKGDLMGLATVPLEQVGARLGETLFPPTSDAAMAQRAQALLDEGRFDEAIENLNGCLVMRQKDFPEGHWRIAEMRSLLGAALTLGGQFGKAEKFLLEGYAGMKDDRQVPADRKRETIERIARLYMAWNQPDRAAEWRRKLEQPGSGPG